MPEDTDANIGIVDGSGASSPGLTENDNDSVDPKTSGTDWEAMYKGESKARIKAEKERDDAKNITATLNGLSDRLGAMESTMLDLDLVTASIRDDVAGIQSSPGETEYDDDGNVMSTPTNTSYADAAQQRATGLSQSQTLARSKERIERDMATLGDRISDRDAEFIRNTWAKATTTDALNPAMGSQLEAYTARLVAIDATQQASGKLAGGDAPSVETNTNNQGDDETNEQVTANTTVDEPPSRREQIAAGGGLGSGVTGSGGAPDHTDVKARVIDSGDPTEAFAAAYSDGN